MTKNKAFSFLELSIVILIIGLFVAAVSSGIDLANDAKLANARSLTNNAPVTSISNLALWLDTVSEKSFSESEKVDGAIVSRWNEIRADASVANYLNNNSGAAGDHPTYEEGCINGLPCLYFNGTGSTLSSPRPLGISTRYLSAFFVFTGPENATESYSSQLFDSATNMSWSSEGRFAFLTSTPKKYFFYKQYGNYGVQYTQCNSVSLLSPGQKYIYSVIDDHSSSIFHYVNGAVANTSGTDNSGATNKILANVGVGLASFKGNLGEIIVFTKALTVAERKSVELYLSKKWDIKINY